MRSALSLIARVLVIVGTTGVGGSVSVASVGPGPNTSPVARVGAAAPRAQIVSAPAPAESAIAVREQGLALVALSSDVTKGQGFLFLLDGELRILTNFHIINGAHKISAIYRAGGARVSEAKVLLVDPNNDIAVLGVSSEALAEMPRLMQAAKFTLTVCSNQAQGRCLAPTSALSAPDNDIDSILSFDGQELRQTEMQGWITQARLIPDQYISGQYDKIWQLPALSRDGVSGSSFYRGSKLMGLVTKVSRGLENKTFAIPIEALASRVGEMSHSPQKFMPTPLILLASARASGGDTGNGGESSQSPASWLLLNEYCPILKCENRQTTDPFFNALMDSSILIDSQSAFVLMQHNVFQGYLFQAATLAERQRLAEQKADVTILDSHSHRLAPMFEQRRQKVMNLLWIQAYRKVNLTTLENLYPATGTFHDGVFEAYVVGHGTNPKLMATSLAFDEIEYTSGTDAWLNFLFAKQNLRIVIAPDLNSASITNVDRTIGVQLRAAPDSNSMKHVLLSNNGRQRIMFIYNELDLTRLEGLVVDTGSTILRFSLTQPNLGFK